MSGNVRHYVIMSYEDKKVSIRLSEEDFNKLKELVDNGESLSAYIRTVLKNHINHSKEIKKKSLFNCIRGKEN